MVSGSSKTDVYSRLKVLEERVLFLESLSPEYFTAGVGIRYIHSSL